MDSTCIPKIWGFESQDLDPNISSSLSQANKQFHMDSIPISAECLLPTVNQSNKEYLAAEFIPYTGETFLFQSWECVFLVQYIYPHKEK